MQQRADLRPTRPRAAAPRCRSTRCVLGDDVPHPAARHLVGEPASAPARPSGRRRAATATPSGRAAASQVARRAAYSPSTWRCGARVSIDEHRQPGGGEVERHVLVRSVAAVEEERVPLLAEHRRRLVHDPAGQPTKSFSARCGQRRPAPPRRRSAARPGRPAPRATAHSSAADDDSPAPTGTSTRRAGVAPAARRCPPPAAPTRRRRRSRPSPSTRPGREVARSARTATRSPVACEHAIHAGRPRRSAAARCACGSANGSTKPSL